VVIATVLFAPVEYCWQRYLEHKENIVIRLDVHEWRSLIVIVLYFGLCTYFTNGKTIGKWMLRIRVVSLTQQRVSLWQSMERALGYGASALEAGFGFLQFFINRNRQCVHDRIAETIVVDERAEKKLHVVDAVLHRNLGEGDAGGSGFAGGEHAGEV
jgi:RDD family